MNIKTVLTWCQSLPSGTWNRRRSKAGRGSEWVIPGLHCYSSQGKMLSLCLAWRNPWSVTTRSKGLLPSSALTHPNLKIKARAIKGPWEETWRVPGCLFFPASAVLLLHLTPPQEAHRNPGSSYRALSALLCETATVITHTVKNLNLRKVETYPQGHMAGKWQSWESPVCPQPVLLATLPWFILSTMFCVNFVWIWHQILFFQLVMWSYLIPIISLTLTVYVFKTRVLN